jgi:hypothetical protein
MSTIKTTKLARAEAASDLFAERDGELLQVMVRSHDSAQGYWGRGWSIQNAMRSAQWLKTGDSVQVFLCSRGARCGQINGGLSEGQMGTIYIGKVTAQRDVRVTHRVEVPAEA